MYSFRRHVDFFLEFYFFLFLQLDWYFSANFWTAFKMKAVSSSNFLPSKTLVKSKLVNLLMSYKNIVKVPLFNCNLDKALCVNLCTNMYETYLTNWSNSQNQNDSIQNFVENTTNSKTYISAVVGNRLHPPSIISNRCPSASWISVGS